MPKKERVTLRTCDRKTKIFLILSILLATIEVGYALYITQIHKPETSIYIEEVFDTFHYRAEGENRTKIWTIGQGILAVKGTHNFTVGYSYVIDGKEIRRELIDPDIIYEYPRKYDFRDKLIPEYIQVEREMNIERRLRGGIK